MQQVYSAVLLLALVPCLARTQGILPGCYAKLATLTCIGWIPTHVPSEIRYVTIDNLVNNSMSNIQLSSECFSGENWANIESLTISSQLPTTFKANAFHNLKSLGYLGTNGIQILNIENHAFAGLCNVHTLDFVFGRKLTLANVISALNGSNITPKLTTLKLIGIDFGNTLNLNRHVLEVLASKPLRYLDLSQAIVGEIDFNAWMELFCDRSVHVSCTKCSFLYSELTYGRCNSLQQIDLGYGFTVYEFPKPFPQNVVINVGSFVKMFDFFTHIDTILANNIYIGITPFPVIRNISFHSLENDTSTVRSVSFAHANIRYLDIKIMNFLSSLHHLDLSSNSMVFIQPKLLPENNTLLSLDLSDNNLNLMAQHNYSDFQNIVRWYKELRELSLTGNGLSFIPVNMFLANTRLRALNLSHNILEELTFSLENNVEELQFLNISNNNITSLSQKSMNILQRLILKRSFEVDLRNNPILCNSCDHKEFIEWILNAKGSVKTDSCQNDKLERVPIDHSALHNIVDVCQRPKRLILSITCVVAGSGMSILTIVVLLKYMKRKSRQTTHKRLIQRIQEGRHKFEFVTFVAYSGEDEVFVEKMIINPLTDILQSTCQTKRELICTGDRHFRLGCTIADQTDACCEKSGAVILVISKSFCESPHCNNEMHIAYTLRKPIILMFREHVEQSDMHPLLRVIFKQFTRVTWKYEDGQYVLSTSWENICRSLLDCMET